MLSGNAGIDSFGAVVCHNEWGVRGVVLASDKLVLHVMRVQGIDMRCNGQGRSHEVMLHAQCSGRGSGR